MTEGVATEASNPSKRELMEIVAQVCQDMPPVPVGLDRSDCLPPDLEYSLDCEQEDGGIGHDDRAFVDLFDTNAISWFLPLTRGNAQQFPEIIKTRHARWRETAPITQRMALTWGGLEALKWLFNGCVSGLSYQVIHHHGVSNFPDGTEVAYLETMNVAQDAGFLRFADCARPIVARAIQDIGVAGPEAFLAARGSLDVLYAEAHDQIRNRNRQIFEILSRFSENSVPQAVRMLGGHPPIRTRAQKQKERGLRKAITRSYRLLGSIAGAETARACLDGDQITVAGRNFDFRLRVANLRSTAHGAIEVFVTDKSAVELANLCIYIDQTPALDQMAALILDVTTGNEDEIIRRSNIIRSTEAATSNATFMEIRKRMERSVPTIPDPDGTDVVDTASGREDLLPAVERRLAEAVDIAAWRPLIELFGPQFCWQRFSTVDRDTLTADVIREWQPSQLAATF